MYRLRDMTVDDKVCEQVSMSLLEEVYPKEAVERCVQQSEPWNSKVRRVRLSTALALVLFVLAMACGVGAISARCGPAWWTRSAICIRRSPTAP